jgi:RNA polymerase sigma-70 factor (sigma-E family)
MEDIANAVSFEDFVASRGQALLDYGYLLSGSPHDAADLVQEALIRLRQSWSRVKAPEPYTRTTMARLHISLWRRRRRERLVATVPEGEYTDESLPRAESGSELWNLLATLPRRQRAVLVLRYYESLSDQEIAAVLEVSPGTVRGYATRALENLRGSWSSTAEPNPMSSSSKGARE